MRNLLRTLGFALLTLTMSVAARADVVTDWNQTTFAIGGPLIVRTLAMVHLAMFDAVNSVTPCFHPYAVLVPGGAGASAEAAAAAAAHGILVRRFPAQSAALAAALSASIASIPDGDAKARGLELGDRVAAEIHALRSNDGMLLPNPPYIPGPASEPGRYQLTPPNFPAPANTGAPGWSPFAMVNPWQFRANGPPVLESRRYAKEVAEVMTIGSADPASRTPDQNQIALWHTEQAQVQLNRIARAAVVRTPIDLLTSARLFALLNVALADASVSVFEAKYAFDFWRPVTAIRNADLDGNASTTVDLTWTPFLGATPPHPEYPSAHAVIQGAGGAVLERFLGPHYAFEATSLTVPGVVRTFDSLRAFVEDGQIARIYGGIHFRSAVEEGAKQGRKVGRWTMRTLLRPL
jgi:hypothetical protein